MISNKKHLVEKTLSSQTLYEGKSFSFCTDEVELPNKKTARRDYVKYPEAAVILPILPDQKIVFIEQFRYSVGKVILELPAGKLDEPSEDKTDAARRELMEESGYRAEKITHMTTYYPALGYSTEVIHAFFAEGLSLGETDPDEDEFIDVLTLGFEEAMEKVKSGEIMDSKTILCLTYYAQFFQ